MPSSRVAAVRVSGSAFECLQDRSAERVEDGQRERLERYAHRRETPDHLHRRRLVSALLAGETRREHSQEERDARVAELHRGGSSTGGGAR
jgi:hypothetical protein